MDMESVLLSEISQALPRPAQQDGAEERVLWNLRKKINIKQDTETFILSKGGNRETQGLRDQEPCLKKPHCFYCEIKWGVAMGGWYRVCLESHLGGKGLSSYSDL